MEDSPTSDLGSAVYRQRYRTVLVLACSAIIGLSGCGGGGGGGEGGTDSGVIGTGPGSAVLEWSGAADTRVSGYRIYVGTSSGNYLQTRGRGINVGAATRGGVSGLSSSQTYYFAVTSYDSAGNESDYSAEVSKTIN